MNISPSMYQKFNTTWWILKITYGLLYVIAGADKFTNLVVHWQKYLNPMIPNIVGIDPATFMLGVGIVEISIGLLTLTQWTKLGAYLIAAWFAIIVLNILSLMTFFDIAVRDTVLAIGAFALAQLTTIKE